ncbi:MAG: ribokinase [Alphaproteobacteria bacterium]|nr:ribokinase [Alphaproteobacteria bacterium]
MLLVFGSLNADMLFKVEALPRPGETVLCPGYELAAGGKGANQAAAAAKAGADVHMVGHLGADSFGNFTRDVMVKAGVNCDGVATSKRATAIAVIGVDQAAENQIIVASGANLDTHADQVSPELFHAGVTVLCQNEIREDATFELLKRAKAGGARTLLNLAPAARLRPGMADHLDILVVNEIEAAMAAGQESIGNDALAFAADLGRTMDLTVVITLGADGAVAAGRDGRFKVESLAVQPVDTTGAGDAFVGVLAAALDQGEGLPSALRQASVGAGLACMGLGAQTSQPVAADIQARLHDVSVEALD